MEKSKKEHIYIFFIVILSILLAGMIFLTLSGWLYKENYKAKTSFIPGGEAVLHLDGTGVSSIAYTFDGGYVAGESLAQNISVKNDGEKSLYLRAKINIFTGENQDPKVDMLASENWIEGEDGYFYFEGNLESLNTAALLSGFEISPENQIVSADNYILVVEVEGLSTDFDRLLVWGK